VGFPLYRVVALLCLVSGALLDAATGPRKGKGSDEQALLRSILDTLSSDDIVLGDAYYATYFLFRGIVCHGGEQVMARLSESRQRRRALVSQACRPCVDQLD